MTGFQRGDVQFAHQGHTYTLRLTMGALALIEARLGASGPRTLAQKLRNLNCASDAQALLACLLHYPPSNGADTSSGVEKIPPAVFMPAVAEVFERAFQRQGCE